MVESSNVAISFSTTRRSSVASLHLASSSTMFTVPNALVKSRKILKSHALSDSLRHRIKKIFHEEFDAPVDGDIVIQHFCGEERQEQAEDWIKQFQKWGVKHGLTPKGRLAYAVVALTGKGARWCKDFQLERATWRDFYNLFTETFVRRWPCWSGSRLYPYYLQFHGTARGNPGHAGVGAVLTTPNQEHDFGCVSAYIGPHCMTHVAAYEALIAGLEKALEFGVGHILACGDDPHVINQVTKAWRMPQEPELRHCLAQVWLIKEHFHSFEIVCCIERRYNSPPRRLADNAIDICLSKQAAARQGSPKSSPFLRAGGLLSGSQPRVKTPLKEKDLRTLSPTRTSTPFKTPMKETDDNLLTTIRDLVEKSPFKAQEKTPTKFKDYRPTDKYHMKCLR